MKEGNKNSNSSASCSFYPHCLYEHAKDTEKIELFEVKDILEKCVIILFTVILL